MKRPIVSSSAVVVKSDYFNLVASFNTQFSRGEDIDMWTRLVLNFKFDYETELLSYYRLDAPNRARQDITSIDKFYLEKNSIKLNKYHKKYIPKLIVVFLANFII